jgi:hypothetical protein
MYTNVDLGRPSYWLEPEEFWTKWFTLDEIDAACELLGIKSSDLVEQYSSFNGHEPHHKKYVYLGRYQAMHTRYTTFQGRSYENHEMEAAENYAVRDQYQGLKHGDILKVLLSWHFPWFDKFQWDIYEVNYKPEHYEIYMKVTGNEDDQSGYLTQSKMGSLYIPFEALMNSDWKTIEKRMRSYWKSYSGDKGIEHCKFVLASEEAQRLKEILEENNDYQCPN